MMFNDLAFLLLFLPTALALGLAVRGAARIWVLIGCSLLFYGSSGLVHVTVLILSILWVHALTAGPGIAGSRARLVLAFVLPLGALLYFKYASFLLSLLGFDMQGAATPDGFSIFADLLLPAGISFYTIQLCGYAVDRYRGTVAAAPRLSQLLFFVSFFPQLVAGPIVRWTQIAADMRALPRFRLGLDDAGIGLRYLVLGLAWKVLLADRLAVFTGPLAEAPAALGYRGLGYLVFAYSFQIYFDFYGYSLMAIGMGRWFGIRLPVNFDRPYAAPNPRAFWQRWHISLSYWIRDYVYLPLGGNRHYARNILIVFALCGLWHGASLSFVVWGLVHAAMVVSFVAMRGAWERMPVVLQTALTFVAVSCAWLLFLFDFGELTQALSSVGQAGMPVTWDMLLALALAAAVCFGVRAEVLAEGVAEGEARKRSAVAAGAGYALLFAAALLFVEGSQTFIYFRF